jgi:cyclopropane fatty-acyl-phospholipid synthase-like methyltransferase
MTNDLREREQLTSTGARLEIQVEPELYFTPEYCHPQRFASFGYQVHEALSARPGSILEIGIGSGIVAQTLRACGVQVTTLDLDPALRPSVAGSVTDLPFATESFDVVLCCEVLEHLPYERAEHALGELARVTRRRLLISVPDKTRHYRFEITLPKFGRLRRWVVLPHLRPLVHHFNGHHYWELGRRDYSVKRMCTSICATGMKLDRTYRLWEHPIHRMFIATKANLAREL